MMTRPRQPVRENAPYRVPSQTSGHNIRNQYDRAYQTYTKPSDAQVLRRRHHSKPRRRHFQR